MARYCVGITMAVDWGEDEDSQRIDQGLARGVFSYFRPFRRLALLAPA
jgi:hypothetical protein